MKKILLCFYLLLLIPTLGNCKKIPGYFINKEGDTIQALFKIPVGLFSRNPSYDGIQSRVVYYHQDGKKGVLKPADAREVCIFFNSDTTRFLSRRNTLGIVTSLLHDNSYLFLKLIEDGQVKLFSYVVKNQSGGFGAPGMAVTPMVSYSYDRYILQYGNHSLVKVKGITFRRDMMDFFSDFPELAEKIDDRAYRMEHLREMVKMYNKNQHHSLESGSEPQKKNGF